MDKVTLIGIVASFLTATASIPQLLKIIRSRKANDISRVMVAALVVGLGLWVCYGLLKSDWIIVVANSIPCAVNTAIFIASFCYDRKNTEARI